MPQSKPILTVGISLINPQSADSLPKCAACKEIILDRFILRLASNEYTDSTTSKTSNDGLESGTQIDQLQHQQPVSITHWHARCLTCVQCNCQLTLKCYMRNGKPYCREDFFRRFAKTRCAHCEIGIAPNSQVRRVQENVYHLSCFDCIICKKQLNTGDEFYLMDDNRLVCKADYEAARQRGEWILLQMRLLSHHPLRHHS